MIRREVQNDWLLISQVEHARLAGEIANAWSGNKNLSALPMKQHLLPAINQHDEGWIGWNETPLLNVETGSPRDFLDMPMLESTLLWGKSITFCSGFRTENAQAGIHQFQRFLTRSGRRLSSQRAFVVEEIFAMSQPFDVDALTQQLGEHPAAQTVGRPTLIRLLGLLEAAGMLKRLKHAHGATLYQPPGVDRITTPLGGLWVSRFFCDLASRAKENRTSDEDLQAIELFQKQQQEFQQRLLKSIAENFTQTLKQFDREGVTHWKDTGLRWLQLFDRLSLWFCCKQETETFHIDIPNSKTTLHLTPLASGEIAVDPFPFEGDQLQLSVSGRLISAKPYHSETELHNAIASAPCKQLHWSLVRW